MGEILRRHADAGILHGEAQGPRIIVRADLLDAALDPARGVGVHHGVFRNALQNVPDLALIPDKFIVDAADALTIICKALFLALGADGGVELHHELPEGKARVLEGERSGVDVPHIQHIVDEGEQVPCARVDLVQMGAARGRDPLVLLQQAQQAQDRVEGRAHLMAHVGEKILLGPVCGLRRHQLCLKPFGFVDMVRNAPQQIYNDKNKNTAAEENAGHQQVGLAEKGDHEIADQKQDQQNSRNEQDHALLVPAPVSAELAGEADVAVDVVHHQSAAEIDHPVNKYLKHTEQPSFQHLPAHTEAIII